MKRPLCLLYEFLVAIAIDEIGKDRHLSGKVGQGEDSHCDSGIKGCKGRPCDWIQRSITFTGECPPASLTL